MDTFRPISPDPRITDLEARQAAIEARQVELERRIAELEAAATRQWPWGPVTPYSPPSPYYPPIGTLGCHVCGRGTDGKPDWYVCMRDDCPGRISCQTGDPVPPTTYVGDPPPGHGPTFTCGIEAPKLAKDVHPPRYGDSVYGR